MMTKFFFNVLTLAFVISLLSCAAQQPLVSVQRASRGNTGLRGRVPDNERDKPLKGNDFAEISLTATKDCKIDSVFVTLKEPDVRLRDESQQYPKQLKTNDVFYVRVENITALPTHWKNNMRDTCEGFVEIFSKGKNRQIAVKNFTRIIPK